MIRQLPAETTTISAQRQNRPTHSTMCSEWTKSGQHGVQGIGAGTPVINPDRPLKIPHFSHSYNVTWWVLAGAGYVFPNMKANSKICWHSNVDLMLVRSGALLYVAGAWLRRSCYIVSAKWRRYGAMVRSKSIDDCVLSFFGLYYTPWAFVYTSIGGQ